MDEIRYVYLDYNATTPVRDEVVEEMTRAISVGNPSSIHWSGREARNLLNSAREKVAEILGVEAYEIIFNSGATEGNNTVLKGIYFFEVANGRTPYIISTKVEHSSVIRPLEFLAKLGAKVEFIPVDRYGLPDPDDFKKSIKKNGKPSLISIMHVNNETGVIMPVKDVVKIAKEYDVLVHVDMAQSAGKIRTNLRELGIDFATFSAHKFYGPKGAGVFYIKKGTPLEPLLHGGKQEDGLRAGTQDVAGAVGFAKALELAVNEMDKENERLKKLQRKFESMISEINGVLGINGHPEFRVPNTSNVLFDVEGEALVISLDLEGIAVSQGSACSAESKTPSHVLLAMGFSPEQATNSVRFSFGKYTSEEDIEYTVEKLKKIIRKLRR